jgi:hypothetical protein
VFILWSAEAAWGRYEIPGTRFKFDLLGMQRITGLDGADTINDHCSWYGDHKEMSQCAVAPGASSAFRRVQLAPLTAALSATALLVAVAIDVTGRRRSAIVLASIVGAVAMFGALRLLTGNVGTAMRVYAGHSVEMNGSGLTAAWLVVFAFIAMGAISLVPAAWSGRRRRA